MKKSKLTTAKQAHGQVVDTQPTTLDQIWGDTGMSRYGTLNEDEYLASLNEMNKADLNSHAANLRIMPIDNRERLVKALLKEFRLYASAYKHPRTTPNPNKPVPKEISKILSEGR